MKTSVFRENIVAFVVAVMLSWIIIFSINSFGLLDMNMLGLKSPSQWESINYNQWDVVLKIQWGDVNLVSNIEAKKVRWIWITLLANPEVISASGFEVATSLKDALITVSNEGDGILSFFINRKWDLHPQDVILSFPFSGEIRDINIWDITITDSLGTGRSLTYFKF